MTLIWIATEDLKGSDEFQKAQDSIAKAEKLPKSQRSEFHTSLLFAGLKPSALSRRLGRLVKAGLVRHENGGRKGKEAIVILDPDVKALKAANRKALKRLKRKVLGQDDPVKSDSKFVNKARTRDEEIKDLKKQMKEEEWREWGWMVEGLRHYYEKCYGTKYTPPKSGGWKKVKNDLLEVKRFFAGKFRKEKELKEAIAAYFKWAFVEGGYESLYGKQVGETSQGKPKYDVDMPCSTGHLASVRMKSMYFKRKIDPELIARRRKALSKG